VAASALQPKSVLASSDALRLREFAQLSIIGAFVLLSPVLALLAAIAVEIAIDILLQAGGPPLPACVAAGAIGWMVLRRLGRRQGGRSSRNMRMRRCLGTRPSGTAPHMRWDNARSHPVPRSMISA
jgi:hypothetical protein